MYTCMYIVLFLVKCIAESTFEACGGILENKTQHELMKAFTGVQLILSLHQS